jgi:RHS repeat-associated protein
MNKKMLLAALLAWSVLMGHAFAQTCAPGTCCSTNPTTGTPACGAAAGNPLNVMSGNKFQREVDMPALPGVLGLELVRYYNSEAALDNYRGIMGRGWRLSYEAELAFVAGDRITVHQGDGTQTRYEKAMVQFEPGVTVYNTNEPGQQSLRAQRVAGSLEYTLKLANGNRQTFDAQGKLVRITAPTGEYVSLQRDVAGFLLRVTDPQGRFLSLRHLPAHEARTTTKFRGVQTIDTPVGRFTYSYGSAMPAGSTAKPDVLIANLVKVDLPTHYEADKKVNPLGASGDRGTTTSSVSRLYHYENARYPTLLTGITVKGKGSDGKAMDERIVTWGYDARGRANLSVKGSYDPKKPGPEQVTLEFHTKSDGSGTTVLTNSLGQATSYSYAQINGKAELLEVRGAGCATCGPVNERHRYDKRGRLMEDTQLDAKGQAVAGEVMEYDGIDRLIRVSEVRYRNGKAGALRMLVRYQYGEVQNQTPTVIARPSVVAGKEHITRIDYNDAGQPTRIAEEGFSPIDEKGNPSPQGTPISRATTFTYDRINGRSVLAQIDGPLPNGPLASPKDSDITRIEWNSRADQVLAVIRPMNLKSAYQRETGTGRVSEAVAADGVITRYEYADAQVNRPTAMLRPGRRIDYSFDAQGRATRIEDAPGRAIDLSYDIAGRLFAAVDAQGYKAEVKLDTEDAATVAGLYEPKQTKPLRATYNWYDEQHRLARRLLPDGRIDTWRYDDEDRMVEHVDGDGVLHVRRRADDTAAFAEIDLSPDGLLRAHLEMHQPFGREDSVATMRDDFGRRVFAWLSGQGARQWFYDAADRLIKEGRLDRHAQLASSVLYRRDAAGREVEQDMLDAQGKPVQTHRLRYEGALLAEDSDDTQTLRYRYDEAARVAASIIELKDEQGHVVYSTELGYEYDQQTSELRSRKLADGSWMRIERGVAQVARRMSVQSAFWSGVDRLLHDWLPESWAEAIGAHLPQQSIASNIASHPYNGITGYMQGNGITTTKQFDIAGRLTAIRVSARQGAVSGQTLKYKTGPRVRSIDQNGQNVQYEYNGFGWLKPGAQLIKVSAEPHRPERDAQGRTAADQRYRYTYTPQGQISRVSSMAGTLVAKYRYNAQAERVSKTVYAQEGEHTTYYLWDRGRIVAEISGSGEHKGELTAQYLYLVDQSGTTPVAKLESAHAEGNATRKRRELYIHADHRGQPIAMTDDRQRMVWRARPDEWGYVKAGDEPQQAVLNLRLPGQYYDEETGLYDNWHRSYDPRPESVNHGRYLSPDPQGYPDGPDAYAYVSGDPVNKVDPTGLYEIDVHYYMTYFLAVMAGIDSNTALRIALGDQYVDDNPNTSPMPNGISLDSLKNNKLALLDYHFVLSDSSDPNASTYGDTLSPYKNGNVSSVTGNPSPQLTKLKCYADNAPDTNSRSQFFGEYLHAFEDTFGHRDSSNVPIDALSEFGGTGHTMYGHNPDYTYNHSSAIPLPGHMNWDTNEARTDAMESAVFSELKAYAARLGTASSATFGQIEIVVDAFNSYAENESNTGADGLFATAPNSPPNAPKIDDSPGSASINATSKKLIELNTALKQVGLSAIPYYSVYDACTNRLFSFVSLQQKDYPGAILNAPPECPTSRPGY